MVFVYDFYPGAETMMSHHFNEQGSQLLARQGGFGRGGPPSQGRSYSAPVAGKSSKAFSQFILFGGHLVVHKFILFSAMHFQCDTCLFIIVLVDLPPWHLLVQF